MFAMDRRSLILGSAAVVVSSALSRGYAQAPTGPFKLDPLPYPTNKNEPHIDAQTMEIHHDRHHAAYVNNLNGVMAQQPDLAKAAVARAFDGSQQRAGGRSHDGAQQ